MLALLVLLVVDIVHSGKGAKFTTAVAAGKRPPAPGFSLATLSTDARWPNSLAQLDRASRVQTADLHGAVLVLNFWASWCTGCKAEQRNLEASAKQLHSKALFVGIDVTDFNTAARHYLTRYGVSYPTLRDPSGSTATRWGVAAVPETFVIDRQGRVVAHLIGPIDRRQLTTAVNAANQASA